MCLIALSAGHPIKSDQQVQRVLNDHERTTANDASLFFEGQKIELNLNKNLVAPNALKCQQVGYAGFLAGLKFGSLEYPLWTTRCLLSVRPVDTVNLTVFMFETL